MDKFEKKIIEKIREQKDKEIFGIFSKIIDIKPRTEYESGRIRFDVIVATTGMVTGIVSCLAFEFDDIDWDMLYIGSALYDTKIKKFVSNYICNGKFTMEMSQRWLRAIEVKLEINGGI